MKTYYFKTWLILLCFAVLTCTVSCSKDNLAEDNEIIESSEDNENNEDIEDIETSAIQDEILRLVNVHRASINKEPLVMNALAIELAEEHTRYMIEQNEISHDDFDKRANRLFDEANASRAGENVAYGQKSAKDVMDAWLDSPGHRENIEDDFTHIGIGAIKNSSGVYYFAQIFLTKD